LLSACGGAAATATVGGGKVKSISVAFIGLVDSTAGDQWVINGQTATVTPEVIRDGPFEIGDQVKVEGVVNSDGSFSVSRVEVPTPQDSSSLPQFGDDNSNDANSNDAKDNGVNSNDDNGNDANSNDDNGNDDNSNDDNGGNDNSDDDDDDNSNSGGDDDNGGDNDNDD